jgi:predicted nucleic acid-binding Zn ribbon protein
MVRLVKTCPYCGEVIKRPAGKTCGKPECKRIYVREYNKKRYWEEKKRRVLPKKGCPYCGKEFEYADDRKVYCSRECQMANHNERRKRENAELNDRIERLEIELARWKIKNGKGLDLKLRTRPKREVLQTTWSS